jgi:hypothetical protein
VYRTVPPLMLLASFHVANADFGAHFWETILIFLRAMTYSGLPVIPGISSRTGDEVSAGRRNHLYPPP